jgi:hypothetical protein
MQVTLPNNWSPRPHQLPFFNAMDDGKKRACLVWHRRAGKDSSVLNYTAKSMFERVGNYWHLFPKQTQARKAIWNGIDGQGRKILEQAFPKEIRNRDSQQEMMIETVNKSTWQLCGSDNYDSLVGANPVGVVFSEWSLCDPKSWDYIRPMLAENGGWAIFIYTSRGKNHGHSLYKMASRRDDWYCEMLTVDDTKREDGSPVIGPEIIQDERDEGMSEAMIQQEYFCSFDAQIPGAIYGREMALAIRDNRIGRVPIEPSLQVHTAWDLGISDAMTIWFFQAVGKEVRLIHYYENHNFGMEHYANYIKQFKNDFDIQYGEHLAPHDIEVRELMSGKSRKDAARSMGLNFRTVERPKTKPEGHQAVRKLFPRLWIDEERCEVGVACLSEYSYEWDEKAKMFKDRPSHNWASHGADALQTLALGWRDRMVDGYKQRPPHIAKLNVNLWGSRP